MSEMPVITWEFSNGIVRSNPKIAGGAPLIDGCGISVGTLFNAVSVEGGIEEAAQAYGVESRHLMLAKQYIEFIEIATVS